MASTVWVLLQNCFCNCTRHSLCSTPVWQTELPVLFCCNLFRINLLLQTNVFLWQMLQDLIALCLKTAVKDNMSSIAFPTIGCGHLGFNPATVAECFKAASRDTDAALTVQCSCIEHYFCNTKHLVCVVLIFALYISFVTAHI